jgi:hypothetical protein
MTNHFQMASRATLFLAFAVIFVSPACRTSKDSEGLVAITPSHATVDTGATQKFAAIVKGTNNVSVRWSVQEEDGGRITEDGIYTAPKISGIYHVLAENNANPRLAAIAEVTVLGQGHD